MSNLNKKLKRQYVCTQCATVSLKWLGQCLDCNSWGTVQEEIIDISVAAHKITNLEPLKVYPINSLQQEQAKIYPTSIKELNRVLGGGLIEGAAILIGGAPGIGKSTLLLQLSNTFDHSLYISAEESEGQVQLRSNRLKFDNKLAKEVFIASANNIEQIISTLEAYPNIRLLIIDSIQNVYSNELSSAPGTVSQIRSSASMLINYTKAKGIILILVGHITKDGQLAGPKVLEHMVDTVLYFEDEQHYCFRILRTTKNRFGSVNEIGVFEMTNKGLAEVDNPSQLFLSSSNQKLISGTSIFAGMEGARPILVEIQVLLSPSHMSTPRRSVIGWDLNRLSMLIAVLAVRYGLNITGHEVYLNVMGGLRITEPAADLAVVAALISAAHNKPIPYSTAFFGEVSLSGEVRGVVQPGIRIAEAHKMKLHNVYCPSLSENFDNNLKTNNISHILDLKDIF